MCRRRPHHCHPPGCIQMRDSDRRDRGHLQPDAVFHSDLHPGTRPGKWVPGAGETWSVSPWGRQLVSGRCLKPGKINRPSCILDTPRRSSGNLQSGLAVFLCCHGWLPVHRGPERGGGEPAPGSERQNARGSILVVSAALGSAASTSSERMRSATTDKPMPEAEWFRRKTPYRPERVDTPKPADDGCLIRLSAPVPFTMATELRSRESNVGCAWVSCKSHPSQSVIEHRAQVRQRYSLRQPS